MVDPTWKDPETHLLKISKMIKEVQNWIKVGMMCGILCIFQTQIMNESIV